MGLERWAEIYRFDSKEFEVHSMFSGKPQMDFPGEVMHLKMIPPEY